MTTLRLALRVACIACIASTSVLAQTAAQPDWARLEEEAIGHFQALVRMDTSDPPGNEQPAVDYLKQLLEQVEARL